MLLSCPATRLGLSLFGPGINTARLLKLLCLNGKPAARFGNLLKILKLWTLKVSGEHLWFKFVYSHMVDLFSCPHTVSPQPV